MSNREFLQEAKALIESLEVADNASFIELARIAEIDLKEDLTGLDLTGMNLAQANFASADLARTNFTKTDLTGANFTEADLTGADFTEADLTGANLIGSKGLSEANFTEATLARASFSRVDANCIENLTETQRESINSGRYSGSGARILRLYSTRIDKQIMMIEDDLYSTTGVWLKKHRYSAEDIRKSKHFAKLNSIEEQIYDNISLWEASGAITEDLEDAYRMFNHECKNKREKLLNKIRNRKRTTWEAFIAPLTEVCESLFSTLPTTLYKPVTLNKQLGASSNLEYTKELTERIRQE